MIKINKAMNRIINNKVNHDLAGVDRLVDLIIQNSYFVNECVIYSDERVIAEDIDWKMIFKIFRNKTDYEYGCNEIICDKDRLNPNLYQLFGEKLKLELFKKFNVNFIVYILEQEANDFFEIRFHIDRTNDGENFCLADDLDEYDDPIMIIC